MKKIILLFVLVFIFVFTVCFGADAKAPDYYNILSYTDLELDENGVLSMKNNVNINYDNVTIAITHQFLEKSKGMNKFSTTIDNGVSAETYNLLCTRHYDMYFLTINTKGWESIRIFDFFTRGTNNETLRINEVMLYPGVMEDFKGFRKYERMVVDYEYHNEDFSLYTTNSNPISKETLSTMVKAYDNKLGDLTDSITIDYGEYLNTNKAGIYPVVYKVSDDNKTSSITCLVNVIDTTKPKILGPEGIKWYDYSNPLSKKDILSRFTISDDTTEYEKLKIELIDFDEEWFKYPWNNMGVTLSVTDEAGNEASKYFLIQYIDEKDPVIYAKDATINLSEIIFMTGEDYIKYIGAYATDESCEPDFDCCCFEFRANGYMPGTYNVEFRAMDMATNETVEYYKVTIVDDIPPEFYVKTSALNTSSTKALSEETILESVKCSLEERGILFDKVVIVSVTNDIENKPVEVQYAYSYLDSTNFETVDINYGVKEEANYMYYLLIIPLLSIVWFIYNTYRKKQYKIIRFK